MSSSNKKTFTTSETSKQADATVTSDAILLEPTTTDHVLVVTSDSAANLTGDVNVELEMSPDGVDWCPVQTKTTTTTAGTTTDPQVGNTLAVDMSGDTRDKFARGRLEYNLSDGLDYSGSYPEQERSRKDGSDFVHHMIAVNKSFNYSGWYNSDVQPSSTYTPILFRNGGIDLFENTKAVELTDSVTQNLCESATLPFSSTFLSANSFSISGWVKTPLNATGTLFSDTHTGLTAGMKFEVTSTGTSISYLSTNPTPLSQSIKAINDGQWHHVLYTYTPSQQEVYIDGLNVDIGNNSLTDADLNGANGFTLLGDGQNNANAASPAALDASKLQATLSNWSIHSEALDQYAAKQLYSNGHVRNAMNLPSIDSTKVEAFWQLNDTVNPENDLSGNARHLLYQAPQGSTGNQKYAYMPATSTGGVGFSLSSTSGELSLFPSLGAGLNYFPYKSEAWTISMWINGNNVTSGSNYYNFLSMTNGSDAQMKFYANNNLIYFQFQRDANAGGVGFRVGATNILTNTWNHVVITKQTSTNFPLSSLSLYINGQPVTYTAQFDTYGTAVGMEDDTVTHVEIGGQIRSAGTGNYLAANGSLNYSVDELICFNTHLDSTKVIELYNLGSYIDPSTLSFSSNIDSYFKMGDNANDNVTNVTFVDNQDTTRTFSKGYSGNQSLSSHGSGDVIYEAPTTASSAPTLPDAIVDADGATLVQDTINGNAMTLSLTKNFDFVSESWVDDASGEACFCLSFNGFEAQAEYFALWKCHQIKENYNVNFLDGNWHNIVLSYRNTTEGSNVKFGPYNNSGTGVSAAFNWNLSMDGIELNTQNNSTGVDYIGGLNVLWDDAATPIGFPIYNRHLKYVGNSEEKYLAHTQGGATNIYESSVDITLDNPYGFVLQAPKAADTPWTFQGLIDETSFHSQDFWTSAGGSDPTNFEAEYPATIYGNTNGLSGTRGTGATYAEGIPYPLNDPSAIGAVPGDSQYINPNRYDAATNPGGGLEAWWRWGDTENDCGENINDVEDSANGVANHSLRAVSIDPNDLYQLAIAPDSTYLENIEGVNQPGSSVTALTNIVIESIVDTACNVKDIAVPILQYLRVKFTGAGSTDLGKGKTEATMWWKKRRIK